MYNYVHIYVAGGGKFWFVSGLVRGECCPTVVRGVLGQILVSSGEGLVGQGSHGPLLDPAIAQPKLI